MSTDYDPVRWLVKLGHGVLAASVRDGTEVTVQVSGCGTYCVYRPKLVINVDPAGKILLGDPMGVQLALDPAWIRVSSGVSQLPANHGIAWESRGKFLAPYGTDFQTVVNESWDEKRLPGYSRPPYPVTPWENFYA